MLAKILTNRSHQYFQNMKSQFTNFAIEDEKDFEEAVHEIVNQTIQYEFNDQQDKIQEFLFFQDYKLDCESPIYECLKMLLKNYTYEMYLLENMYIESDIFINKNIVETPL
jgi:hypothetical protein